MKEQIEERLNELKSEYEKGEKMFAELQEKQMNMRETLLRITGAIQVIGEELERVEAAESKTEPETVEVS